MHRACGSIDRLTSEAGKRGIAGGGRTASHLAGLRGAWPASVPHRCPHGLAACRIAADAAIRSRKNSAAIHRAIQADRTTTPLTSPSWWK